MANKAANIGLAILHGSRATGVSHEKSDWDVAVLGDHKLDWDEMAALREHFGAILKVSGDVVDIADLYSDSPLLRYRAAMEGKLLEGGQNDFRKFQVRAWKDYLNNQKFFDLRSQFLKNALNG
jgi:predicted nucleotidyltransferase